VLTERARVDGLQTYRAESERAVAETNVTAQSDAAQPLADQLQAARDRIDQLELTRIDRVDISVDALIIRQQGGSNMG